MNSGITAERVYDGLKRRVLDLEFRPGTKLDPAMLGEDLGSSVTPVREALNRLRGEGLIETRTGGGFFMASYDAPSLQDLYDWNREVVLAALRQAENPIVMPTVDKPNVLNAATVADLFHRIGNRSVNAEHARALAQLNDRLRPIRIAEDAVLVDQRPELEALHIAMSSGTVADLRRLIATYHRRRRSQAATIVRYLYRHPDV